MINAGIRKQIIPSLIKKILIKPSALFGRLMSIITPGKFTHRIRDIQKRSINNKVSIIKRGLKIKMRIAILSPALDIALKFLPTIQEDLGQYIGLRQ